MGQHVRFRCRNCDLEADVSGGPDRGLYTETRTVWCDICKLLQDVEVQDASPFECGKCKSNQVMLWQANQPCPACAGALVNTRELSELWD